MSQMISCPMCSFQSFNEYETQLHVESIHLDRPTNETPTIHTNDHLIEPLDDIKGSYIQRERKHNDHLRVGERDLYDNASITSDDDREELDYIICSRPDCGEPVLIEDLETHTEIHESAEDGEDTMVEHTSDQKGRKLGRIGTRDLQQSINKNETDRTQGTTDTGEMQYAEDGGVKMCDWDFTHGPGRSLTADLDEKLHSGIMNDRHQQKKPSPSQLSMNDEKHNQYGNGSKYYNTRTTDTSAISSRKGKSRLSEFAREFYGTHLASHKKTLSQEDRRSLSPSSKVNESSTSSSSRREQYDNNTTKPRFGGYALSSPNSRGSSVVSIIRKKRFKISELGPYANEERMPQSLIDQLERGGKEIKTQKIDRTGKLVVQSSVSNETQGLVPTIGMLCERDPHIERAWLCHPAVKHVGKECQHGGGFCGYRNIQMMISFCQAVEIHGSYCFIGQKIPNVIQLQTWIEEGWDKGYNAHARVETGGIKYTRKYIGSSEAQTLFGRLGIATNSHAFNGPQAQLKLLTTVLDYLKRDGCDLPGKIIQTQKPPLYLQYAGHSITIIGAEELKDGTINLLVLDPMFSPTSAIKGLADSTKQDRNFSPKRLLGPHRRGLKHLKRHKMFEMVELIPKPAFSIPPLVD